MTIISTRNILLTLLGFAAATGLLFALPALASADSDKVIRPGKPGVEISVGGSGNVLVRGAKVTAKSAASLTATTAIGPSTLTWTIVTGSSTQFVHRSGGASSLADISIGDTVNFSGEMTTATALTVNAKVVKDVSILAGRTAMRGTVSAIDSGNSRFTLATANNGSVTVEIASSTAFVKNGTNVLFSILATGDTVEASGSYDADTKVLTAQRIAIGGQNVSSGEDGKGHGWKGIFRVLKDRVHFNFSFR